MRVTHSRKTTFLKTLAWLSLLAAFMIGQFASQPNHEAMLSHYLGGLELERADYQSEKPIVFNLVKQKNSDADVVVIGEGEGYGGPMKVGILAHQTDTGPRIQKLVLLSNTETPPYIGRLKKKHFFNQFANKPITDDFLIDSDVDGYSGATISARGITSAVRQAVHLGAVNHLKMPPVWQEEQWQFGLKEAGLLLLVALVVFASQYRNRLSQTLKPIIPLLSLVYVGIYTNASISFGSLSSILLGYFPSPKHHPIWWIMMLSVFGGIVFLRRNIYCHNLCPFSTVQELLHKISGINLKLTPQVTRNAQQIILTLIWMSLMLIFLSRHPALGSYEPFSMMFALEGMGMQWYILPFSLVGSLFIPNFWCRLFCPVGFSLNELARMRTKAAKSFKRPRKKKAKTIPTIDVTEARQNQRSSR
ncbi:FMN-binding protein [Pseudomonadota bacterium]